MPAESPFLFPVYAQLPLEPVSGAGARIRTADGRELLDFYGGHAVCALGYGHPAVNACLRGVGERLLFQTNAVPNRERAEAAEALAGFAPEGFDRVFFVNSGAEANENALRLAFRALPGRTTVVAVSGGFHGRTAAAAAVTDGSPRWYHFPALPFEVRRVSRDDPSALDAAVDESVAAVILEPVQGMAGAVALSDAVLTAARRACDRSGALLIFDEVQCGMGRSGRAFACEWSGVLPDLLTTAKALAGGYPAGAVLAPAEIADALPVGSLGTTFGGGPLAAALVTTVIRVIREEGLLARVRRLSDRIAAEAVTGPVVAVQGRGFLLGLVCSRPAREVRDGLLERGILAGTSTDPAVLRLLPPLTLGDDDVDALVAALSQLGAPE